MVMDFLQDNLSFLSMDPEKFKLRLYGGAQMVMHPMQAAVDMASASYPASGANLSIEADL